MTTTRFAIKCMKCGLHFAVHTEFPERHAITTLYCPECGQHEAKFMLWREELDEPIFMRVPGKAELVDINLPTRKEGE